MKKIILVLIISLLMTGCLPSEPISTETSSPGVAPSESVGTETSSPDAAPSESVGTETSSQGAAPSESVGAETNSPDTDPGESDNAGSSNENEKDYYKLKTAFEYEIEHALLEYTTQGCLDGYPWGIFRAFEYLLQCRQSLDEVNEEMGYFYNEKYDDFYMFIEEIAVFNDKETSYRILLFGAWYLPISRMYIQIYNEEYYESRAINEYVYEGGTYQEVLYCKLVQESNKNYLAIIDYEYHEASNTITHYLINFEVNGKEIRNYAALKDDEINGVWSFKNIEDTSLQTVRTVITYNYRTFGPEFWYDLESDSHESFKNNILTIDLSILYQGNEFKGELSLLFKEGFWEVIEAK